MKLLSLFLYSSEFCCVTAAMTAIQLINSMFYLTTARANIENILTIFILIILFIFFFTEKIYIRLEISICSRTLNQLTMFIFSGNKKSTAITAKGNMIHLIFMIIICINIVFHLMNKQLLIRLECNKYALYSSQKHMILCFK